MVVSGLTTRLLGSFKGQNEAGDDEALECWLEQFEERAKLAKWIEN